VWRLRSPSVSLRGAAVRAVACPERDARVFRPRSREAGPSRGMAPLEADPEAAHSLRPSAGGARVGTASRARAVAPPPRRDGLLNRHASVAGPGPGASRAGLVPGSSETRAPSTESLLSILVRLVRRDLHRGMRADLATRLHPLHPCHERERSSTSFQANDLPPRWTTRLAGPFGSPRSRRQDVTSPLLQPTFTSRALDIDTTSGDCLPVVVSKPTAPDFEIEPREERCDHLASGVWGVGRACAARSPIVQPEGRRRTTSRSSGLQRLRA
jgi:hypothetical protein